MKKVLSWVLVLALVLSSFTMAFAGDTANSSDMKDAAAIQNVEAVDVMVATGIIGGYPDGYYYPEKAVTRAEMAKMISIAVNGGEDVGAYYADSCTFADSVNHWAAGYIAYCANEGIIDGRDANTFDPDANVTGVEAAKMMLVALGYDSKIEGFTGGQWAGNVLKAAKAEELFDGCDDFNAGAVLDRDNAAQIIFNGLMAKGVKYDHQYEITTGDTSVTVNTKAEALTSKLYERAFGTDLKPGTANADDFGRPAHSWVYDGDKVGTYADEADFSFVVEDATNLLAAVKAYDEDFAAENGTGADQWVYIDNASYPAVNGVKSATVKLGDVVEFFDTDAATDYAQYKVVISHYDAVQIDVDTDVKDADLEDGISAYIAVGSVNTNDKDLPGYDAATYVDDAVIAVAKSGAKIIDTYVPESVTGEVTKTYSGGYYVDADAYDYVTGFAGKDFANSTIALEKTYDFYLINGYIAGAVYVEGDPTEFYGINIGKKDTTGFGSTTWEVKYVDATGEEVVYPVEDNDTIENAVTTGAPAVANALIKYTFNEDGEINGATAASAISLSGAEMKTNGIIAGKEVSKDVVAFFYDTDAEEWVVYGYADLEAAEAISADAVIYDESKIVALKLTADLVEADVDDVLAVVTDAKLYNVANSKQYYELTALVDGKEVTYSTVAATTDAWNGKAVDKLYVLSLNADGEVSNVVAATADYGLDISDTFTNKVNVYRADSGHGDNPKYTVDGKSGSSIDIDTTGDYNYLSVGYLYVFDGSDWTVEKLNTLVDDSDQVMFIQTSEDSSTWNIAVKGSVTFF